jgi:superfamily II DNA or RNA helicase
MGRKPRLSFDRGTLILHPPPRGKFWVEYATWDDRIEKFRIPAIHYRTLVESLQEHDTEFIDDAKDFTTLQLVSTVEMTPYAHQTEALEAWKRAERQGVVVLPTAAGKTYLAQMAMQATPRSTLIVVPTLDLMHQWYAQLLAAFPDVEIGLLGGGSRDRTPILVATYDSAAIQAENLGDKYALVIFDECHHLPTDFYRPIAEYAIAPYRLGLTATPERSDGRDKDLTALVGSIVYQKTAEELAGSALAHHKIVQIKVKLSTQERETYQKLIQERNEFLRSQNISLGSMQGWQMFVQASARSTAGRRAMLAHRQAREIALITDGKLRLLINLLSQHYPESTVVFTADNATVYKISQALLIPAITHQTPVKERHEILNRFKTGEYKTLIASHVLNEGVDVPEASIAIILSGTGSRREYVQRLGRVLRRGKKADKQAILYEIIAEGTVEEGTSERRRGFSSTQPESENYRQLEIMKPANVYPISPKKTAKAAEKPGDWSDDNL